MDSSTEPSKRRYFKERRAPLGYALFWAGLTVGLASAFDRESPTLISAVMGLSMFIVGTAITLKCLGFSGALCLGFVPRIFWRFCPVG